MTAGHVSPGPRGKPRLGEGEQFSDTSVNESSTIRVVVGEIGTTRATKNEDSEIARKERARRGRRGGDKDTRASLRKGCQKADAANSKLGKTERRTRGGAHTYVAFSACASSHRPILERAASTFDIAVLRRWEPPPAAASIAVVAAVGAATSATAYLTSNLTFVDAGLDDLYVLVDALVAHLLLVKLDIHAHNSTSSCGTSFATRPLRHRAPVTFT